MFILLPPSEGKTLGQGSEFSFSALSYRELDPAREQVLSALIAVSASPEALRILKVGDSLGGAVAANLGLRSAPTSEARAVYSGVLYQAARLEAPGEWSVRDFNARLQDHVATVSALWGLVAPTDLIAAYRLSMGVKLPGLGALASYWASYLREEARKLCERQGVLLDCCSAAYAKAWLPARAQAWGQNVASVVVLRNERVVSHWAKHTRGELAGRLLRCGQDLAQVRTLEEIRELSAYLFAGQAEVSLERVGHGPAKLVLAFNG